MKITDATFTVLPVSGTGQIKPQPGGEQPTWRPGQILQATVTSLKDDQVMLEMHGRQVTARSQLGLQEGQKLLLHVTATSPQVQLQTLGLNAANPQGALLQLLATGWDLPALLREFQACGETGKNPLFATIRDALKTFMGGLDEAGDNVEGSVLATLLRSLGVAHLKHGDATVNLRQVLTQMAGEEVDREGRLSDIAGNLLQGLDMAHQLNLQLLPEGALLLPLPLPFLKQGYLLLENTDESSHGQTESPNKLSLFLSLEKLGEIRIDMLWDMEELLIKFTCEKTQTSQKLSESGEDLRQALHFRPPREILFTTGRPHPEEELMERLTGDLRGLINTRI
ncbi:MAG: hypothetical protein AB7D06_06610 [Pedobacter sp.]